LDLAFSCDTGSLAGRSANPLEDSEKLLRFQKINCSERQNKQRRKGKLCNLIGKVNLDHKMKRA
jgi:hypothetical protein